jgi:hypothetical protein
MRWLASMLVVLVAVMTAPPARAMDAKAEIAALMETIRTSDCIFIRNGTEYDAKAAADHVQAKYDYYRREIASAEDFIDKAASGSMISGKPYKVRCPGAAETTAAEWLRGKLKALRAANP